MRFVGVGDRAETWLPSSYGGPDGPPAPLRGDGRSRLPRAERRADAGVAGNARLTAANAAVLLVLLAAEGVTVLRVRQLLSPHVFIGVVLIPPVLVKVASTTWRFARYYTGVPAYRRKGPPPVLLRLLGPVVVILTLVLLFSGVGLLLVSRPWLPLLLKVHKASFVLWFCAMSVHVLAHLGEVFRLAPRDWLRRTRRDPCKTTAWQRRKKSRLLIRTTCALHRRTESRLRPPQRGSCRRRLHRAPKRPTAGPPRAAASCARSRRPSRTRC